jgi:hypothetical protein
VQPTTHPHLVPRLRMNGAVLPLLHKPSWCAEEDLHLCHKVMEQSFLNYLYPFDTRAVRLFVNTPLYVKCEYFMNHKR